MSEIREQEKTESFGSWYEAVAGDKPERFGRDVDVQEALKKANPEALRMVENLTKRGVTFPVSVIREAIGSGAWDSIMLDALNKRLMKGWQAVYDELPWRKLVSTIKNVKDFKTQYVMQTGDFTTLSAVQAGGTYYEMQFSDDSVSYSVAKYGGMFGLSFEAMTNDDLGVFGNASQKMGGAAARTVNSYVLSTLINANPTLYDSVALFNSTHANYLNGSGSYPLNQANLESAKTKMREQTDLDGNYLELRPKYLLVDPSNEFNARRLLESIDDPSTANRAINVHKGSLEVIVSNYVTDAAWYLIADPSVIETIEMGFLGGRVEPEIFEEASDSGHHFQFDERRWKIRIVFGGAVVDYRGFVGCNF